MGVRHSFGAEVGADTAQSVDTRPGRSAPNLRINEWEDSQVAFRIHTQSVKLHVHTTFHNNTRALNVLKITVNPMTDNAGDAITWQ